MSDRRLRELERRWAESGTKEDRKTYDKVRQRMGLPKLPREVIRHYVQTSQHGHCGDDGKFDIEYDATKGGWPIKASKIHSVCAVELWPRDIYWRSRGFDSTMRKEIFYTEDPDEVTCKTCIRSINKPDKRTYRRIHYAPGTATGAARPAVCGTEGDPKFDESQSHTMNAVTCPACRRIMYRGRRRSRTPRTSS